MQESTLTVDRIPGFEWYLPFAFRDNVAMCKFEEGDTIYRHKPIGENWGEVIKHVEFLISVKYPSRAFTTQSGDENVFSRNWNSRVVFEKFYPNDHSLNHEIVTTQGRLFSFLWKNDQSYFEYDRALPPVLNTFSPKFIDIDFFRTELRQNCIGFAIPHNRVSSLYLTKKRAIEFALSSKFKVESRVFPVDQALDQKVIEDNSNSGLCPCLGVELIEIETNDMEGVLDSLKLALYKGKKDKFNISLHGALILR